MNEPALVGVIERFGGGGHQFGSFPGRYASGAEPIGQRSTRDMLRDEETDSIVGLAKVKNRNNAGMTERCEHLGFGEKCLHVFRGRHPFAMGDLDGHVALKERIAAEINDAEAARVDL